MAETRKLFGMLSAGVMIAHSSIAYSTAGFMSATRKVATMRQPRVSRKRCVGSGKSRRTMVRRRCSLRSSAMAAPSMASQRKQIDATSSIHTTGSEKT